MTEVPEVIFGTYHSGRASQRSCLASEVEAVVQSPTNMAAADIAAVDFNKITSLK